MLTFVLLLNPGGEERSSFWNTGPVGNGSPNPETVNHFVGVPDYESNLTPD